MAHREGAESITWSNTADSEGSAYAYLTVVIVMPPKVFERCAVSTSLVVATTRFSGSISVVLHLVTCGGWVRLLVDAVHLQWQPVAVTILPRNGSWFG